MFLHGVCRNSVAFVDHCMAGTRLLQHRHLGGVYIGYDAGDMSFLSLACYVARSVVLKGEMAAARGCT